MARPLRIEYPGAFYHVTARGNEQREIFKSQRDREKFLSYLESASVRYGAIVHVYCLMGNHYHLLLETPDGNLSQIMRHINGAYTTYFNIKRKRAGHLFQGRYKAILIEADAYALELSRYVHRNPVRAGMVPQPEAYPWSSYRAYIGQQDAPPWLKTEFILGYFGKLGQQIHERYKSFVEQVDEGEGSPLDGTTAFTLLGREAFVEAAKMRIARAAPTRDLPALRALAGTPSMERIVAAASEVCGDSRLARHISLYLCHRHSGDRLKAIGERFGIRESGVSQASRRLTDRLEWDEGLRIAVENVRARLGL